MSNVARKLIEDFLNLKGFKIDFKKQDDKFIIRCTKGNYSYGDFGKTKLECLLKMLVWTERLGYE